MKKSVINQFEKSLREQMDCWKEVTIQREETDCFVSFYIRDEGSCEMIGSPVLKTAIDMEYAFECMYGLHSHLIVEAETVEHIAYTGARPVIRISIEK